MLQGYAGASNVIIKNSSRRLALAISKAVDGAAFIITPRSALRCTDSWSPRGARFPPQDCIQPGSAKRLRFPQVTDPAAPPIRPERHVPNSIHTMHRRMVAALAR